MKKKIIITGGLGYIGSELCKIYSGESWNNQIIVIDNKFSSERVSQLRNWNINFVHADIRDVEKVREHLKNADVVHHLAGITEVAKIKEELDSEKDKEMTDVARDGTSTILNETSENCKIIFPSTHVVFEGIENLKYDIDENYKVSPVLPYAIGKHENENQIKNSGKKYVILRLGSVYGLSQGATRMNIMPNLFSMISSQNGTIRLHGGGKQLKSLVPLIDVARCFKFMEESDNLRNNIFNLTKDNTTVEEVAELCRKHNSKTKIIKTNDKVPNSGYTLSNKKLLNTGFKFLYDLDISIKEMIHSWSTKNLIKELEYVKDGENNFTDFRGKISNHELTEPVNLIGLISSKKGTMRANHYHPQQEQKCLFTNGQIIEVYKDLLNPGSRKITQVVNAGQISIIKPNVAHTMIFTKDTTFLNLVRGEREHENYGITHTIKHDLVTDKEKKNLIESYKFECRSCGSNNLKRVISLGYQPLANNLLNKKNDKCEYFPLELNFCENCFNCQLSVVVDPKKMFTNYLYTSSTSSSFREHFSKAAKDYIKFFKMKKNKSYVIDVGSNDGIALKPFKDIGFKKLLGIEPAKNLAKISKKQKIKTFNGFLEKKNLKKIKGKADLILASNVFAHSDKLKEMAECMLKLLNKNGSIVIEVQYFIDTLKDLTFDNIYHEHYNYWTLTSLKNFFDKLNTRIFKVEKIKTHGGSLRIFISKNKNVKIHKSVNQTLKEEKLFGVGKFKTYKVFGEKINQIQKNVISNLEKLKKKYKKIIAYGAPAKATTSLNFFGITDQIDYIVEDNKLKHNKFVPGVNIQIKSKKNIKEKNIPIVVLAWNFFNEIKKNNKNLSEKFLNIKDLEK